jgi:hypothetical protein
MLIPKNNIKYRSVRRLTPSKKIKYQRFLQMACYQGHLPMNCDNCHMCKNCWFAGLKVYKG